METLRQGKFALVCRPQTGSVTTLRPQLLHNHDMTLENAFGSIVIDLNRNEWEQIYCTFLQLLGTIVFAAIMSQVVSHLLTLPQHKPTSFSFLSLLGSTMINDGLQLFLRGASDTLSCCSSAL